MGTPDFAVEALEALASSRHEVTAVFTQPDKPKGRGKAMQFTPVKEVALRENIPVYQPKKVRDPEVIQKIRELAPDVLVVVAFGQIIPQEILDIAPYGCINVHGSLLPKYRGAAPIQWAVIDGEKESGVTTMQMDAGLDTGPMLMKRSVEITPEDTAGDLTETLSRVGAEMLIEYLRDPEAFPPLPQPEGATYASKLAKAEGKIDWTASADKIADKVRAFNPVPGCFCTCGDEVLKIWMAFAEPEKKTGEAPGTVIESGAKGILAACGGGSVLRITRLQRPGGKQLDVRDFIAGHAFSKGEVLK